jgi:hypothetical protein
MPTTAAIMRSTVPLKGEKPVMRLAMIIEESSEE